jgi:type I restriction enzyme R subunit
LVAPNKLTAIKFKEYLDEIGKVVSEVVISPPDEREGEDDVYKKSEDKVKRFWEAMIDKYGNSVKYEKTIINSFKKHEQPEILIVVDKLLTGFDAPRNTVLFLTRQLREHTLLQAIARVNRVYPGKDFGYIIDYFGNLQNLDYALNTYSGLENFEEDDLKDTLTSVNKEIEKLPQAHSELWDIFKEIRNKYDEPAYEEILADEAKRHKYYDKLSAFSRLLKLALSSIDFCNKTPEKQVDKYKNDAKFFLNLRVSVKRRYFDDVDYPEYEPQVQKLIDKHITTEGEVIKITQLVDVFDKEQREAAVEEITGKAAKADHIASRTLKAINVKMNEDPVYYKKLATLIRETIEAYHQQRISEAEFLINATEHESAFHHPKRTDIPVSISNNEIAISFYGQSNTIFENNLKEKKNKNEISAEIALSIDECLRSIIIENEKPLIDWQNNRDLEGKLKIGIDDILYEINQKYELYIAWEQMDTLIEECLKRAKIKYV